MFQLHYSNELIKAPEGVAAQEDNALAVANTSMYFPRLKLCALQAKEVTSGAVARGGNFALIRNKTDIEDLGDTVELVVCAGRAKALRTAGVIMSVFDKDDAEFKKIMEESKDSNSGSMYGPEYLVYIPGIGEEGGTFATFFMSNPTMRRESKAVHARLRRAATLGSKLITGDKHSWYGPTCTDCSTPLDLPSPEVFEEVIERFQNEKPSAMATVDDDAPERER